MELNWTSIGIILLIVVIAYLIGRLQSRQSVEIPTDIVDLYKGLQDLPAKVLQTIQGSINPQKGKMAELLTYAELRYDYDRIIPLGWPIDFIGVKNNERIDFIEVKSGNFATLTEEEKHIKNLILHGRVNFRLIKVTEEEVSKFVSARKEE
ncbi:MAG: Holliday junction resolvase-like protein [Candidatus Daviesbacteria bacterium]|nr:Holliday junction resolvase-like protein [Candidatus Daviesbacteria bacterium]